MKLEDSTIPLLFLLVGVVHVYGQEPTAPYLTIRGRLLPNNSLVDSLDVGFDTNEGIQCHTDLTTCCNGTHSGQWQRWYPGIPASQGNFITEFSQGMVSLHSVRFDFTGLYRCDIDTVSSIANGGSRETLFVAIHPVANG